MSQNPAGHQLARLLHLVPLAARPGGATYDELAEALDVPRDAIVRDLETLTAREFYHPAGTGDEIQVGLEGDRVRVWSGGPLQRPVRLDLREAAALHLGLRILADERGDPNLAAALRDIVRRIAWSIPDDPAAAIATADAGARDAIRAALIDAAHRHRRIELSYLKPDAREPEPRRLDPYVVVHAEGRVYAIGRDVEADGIRVFRVDRVLDARTLDDAFTVPHGFDPSDYLDGGRVYRADDPIDVTVRYSPRVARWVTERGEGTIQDDGSVTVSHAVADPGWIVRHVLHYGPDAEIVAPAEARKWVLRALSERVPAES